MAPKKKSAFAKAKQTTAAVAVVEAAKIETKEPTPPPSRSPSPDSDGFQTDESMRHETHLDEIYADLAKLNLKTFRVGHQNFPIDRNDPIFEVKAATTEKNKTSDCNCCKLVHFEREKQIKWCSFCGYSNCDDCVSKTRVFPYEKTGNPKQVIPRGPICKLCERKYLIKETLDVNNEQVNVELATIKKLQREIDDSAYLLTTQACSINIHEEINYKEIKHLKHQVHRKTCKNALLYLEAAEWEKLHPEEAEKINKAHHDKVHEIEHELVQKENKEEKDLRQLDLDMLQGLHGEELELKKAEIDQRQEERLAKLEQDRHQRHEDRVQDKHAQHHYPLLGAKMTIEKLRKLAHIHEVEPIFTKIPVNVDLPPAPQFHAPIANDVKPRGPLLTVVGSPTHEEGMDHDANFSSSGDGEDEGALSDLLDEDDANYLNSSLAMLSEDFVEKNVVEEKASGGCCSLF